ncbi:hypothetical protein BJ742DRAFT_335374 [Cladochytrium replicatum]|nr:hypothetical protein BJ742DRAFT_335374 [Cladochytrium replicatum]
MEGSTPGGQVEIPGIVIDDKKTKRARISVPLAVAFLLLLIPSLCLMTVPSYVIMLRAISSSNSDLSGDILKSVVNLAELKATSLLNSTSRILQTIIYSPSLFDVVTAPTISTNDSRTNRWIMSVLSVTDALETASVAVCQRADLYNTNPPNMPMSTAIWWSLNPASRVTWCDKRNLTTCFSSPIDQSSGIAGVAFPASNVTPQSIKSGFTCQTASACPTGRNGQWKAEVRSGMLWLVFAICVSPSPQFGQVPPFAVGVPLLDRSDLSKIFTDMTPSENARIFLMDAQGGLVANNIGIPIANAKGTDLGDLKVSSTTVTDPIISQLSQLIQQSTASFTNFSTIANGHIQSAKLSDDRWTYIVRPLPIYSVTRFYLVGGIPRRDYFSGFDTAQTTAIALTVVLSLVAMVAVVLGLLGVTIPVRNLTREMEKVANFDFSMLEQGYFVENSVISEIRKMQLTFNTLVKAL